MRITLHKHKTIAILGALLIIFIGFIVLDGIGVLGYENIGTQQTFTTSQFARAMFFDIGILATFVALWILYDAYKSGQGKTVAIPLAILTLFAGSLGLLIYLMVRVLQWPKDKLVLNISNSWSKNRR